MSQKILEKLFDSPTKIRLLKLFLRNPDEKFTLSEIRHKTLLDSKSINRQLEKLNDINLVKSFKKRNAKEKYYFLNKKFVFINELQNLVLKSSPADERKMAVRLKSVGRVKLAVLSGIFVKTKRGNSRTDIFLVCDDLKKRKMENFIKSLEAEAGSELNYTILTSEEFFYRYDMFDRFILDILEKPHKKLINKLNIG